MQLFDRYLKLLEQQGLSLKEHCVRTWIYVADIDVNYEGMVNARNDIFRQYGLTADAFHRQHGHRRLFERAQCVGSDRFPHIPKSRNKTRHISRHWTISAPPTNTACRSSAAPV